LQNAFRKCNAILAYFQWILDAQRIKAEAASSARGRKISALFRAEISIRRFYSRVRVHSPPVYVIAGARISFYPSRVFNRDYPANCKSAARPRLSEDFWSEFAGDWI